MHPDMKKSLDSIATAMALKHSITIPAVEVCINSSILYAKLHVLGANVVDKAGKVNMKETCSFMCEELSAIQHSALSTVAKEKTLEEVKKFVEEIDAALQPLIMQYFMGIEPGRLPS